MPARLAADRRSALKALKTGLAAYPFAGSNGRVRGTIRAGLNVTSLPWGLS
jgi:hypothetical protein